MGQLLRARDDAAARARRVDGAVRAGIVHYNTAEEVDRLLAGLAELGVRLLVLGGPKFVGRAVDRRGARRAATR